MTIIDRIWKRRKKSGDQAPAIPRSVSHILEYPGAASALFGKALSLSVYDEMLEDPFVRSAVTVKKLGALAAPWTLDAGRGQDADRKLAFIQYAFDEMEGSVDGLLYDALDAIAKGFAILEMNFVRDRREFKGLVRIESAKPKDPAMFGFDVDEYLNVRRLTLHVPGEPPISLPIEKFVLFAYAQSYGRPTGVSDLRAAHRHWQIKKELIRQWSAHLEKFASPTVTGRYKRGLPEDAQGALLDALDRLQRQSAVVFPDDIEVGLLEASRQARSGYAEAIDYHNREIARAILGQTLTTDDSQRVGSLALGKVHLQILIMQLKGLRRSLAERVVNEQIIRPLIDANFEPGAYPKFRFEETELDAFRSGSVE
jgi:phage gp29-like protein